MISAHLEFSAKFGAETANVTYKSAIRTTLCDIMCTSNTIEAYQSSKREKLKNLVATMPYEKSKTLNGPVKGATLVQKLKVQSITARKTEELKRQRDEFVSQMKRDKYEKDKLRNKAATKIQAVFRGFRRRLKKISAKKLKPPVVLSQSEIYDELCAMATKLELPPIPGLSLEARSRASRRKRKIENIAIFRIQIFFKMLVAKKKAKERLRERSIENVNRAAVRVTNFFKYIKDKNAMNRFLELKKNMLAIKVQCAERVRQSRANVRILRHRKQEQYRRNEAAIIIQRNFAPKYRAMNISRVLRATYKIISSLADQVAHDLIGVVTQDLLSSSLKPFSREILEKEWPVYLSAIHMAVEENIEHVLGSLMSLATRSWIEDELKAIELQREQLAELRESVLMADQDRKSIASVTESSAENVMLAESDDVYDEDQQLTLLKSARTPRSVRSHLPSPGRDDDDDKSSHSRRSSFGSVVSFSDDPATPEFNLAASVANFVSRIAAKVLQRAVAPPSDADKLSNRSIGDDDNSTARSLVSFAGDDASSQMSFRGSIRDFVSKISNKVVTKAIAPDANAQLRNTNDFGEPEGVDPMDNSTEVIIPGITEGKSNVLLGPSILESTEQSMSLDPAVQLTTSISDFMTAIAQQSMVQPSEEILTDSIINDMKPVESGRSFSHRPNPIAEMGSATPLSSRSLISAPEVTHSASVELLESVSSDAIPVSIHSQVRKSSQSTAAADSNLSLMRIYTENIKTIGLSEEDKDKIEISIEDSLRQFAYAKYDVSVQALNFADGIIDALPTHDHSHTEFVTLRALITLIKANNFFAVADYENSKQLYDFVLKIRSMVYGDDHLLVAEVKYHLAEWFRAQALYTQAEELYLQSIAILETSIKEAATEELQDLHPIILVSRILVGYTDMLRNSGQYLKANETLKQAQSYIRVVKSQGALSFELQGDFICCLVASLQLKGKLSNALVLHQELLDKRRVYFSTMRRMSEEDDVQSDIQDPIPHPKLATSLCSMGALLLVKCEYIDACKLIEDSLSIRRQVYPADHPAIATSLYVKATAFIAFGKYQDAAIEMANSLEIRLKKLGQNHPAVAQSLTGIATIQTLLGYPNDALPNYFKGLTIRKEKFGTDIHKDIVDSLFQLGINAETRGVYLEAVGYIENAIQLQNAVLSSCGSDKQAIGEHINLEWIKIQLARLYTKVSRIEEAKAIMKSSVKAISKVLGQGNALVAKSLCFLGELCRIRGNYFDAKTLFSLSFATANQLFGDNHPDVAKVLMESGENFRISGFYTEASELIATATDISLILFGRENLTFSNILFRKAQVLRDSNQLMEAEKYYIDSLTVVSNRVGEKNGIFGMMLADLSECYRLMKNKEIAEEKFRESLNILKDSNGEGSLIMAETLCNYCNLLIDIRNPSAAAKVLADGVLPIFDNILGREHPWTKYSRANLAVATLLHSLSSMIFSQNQQNMNVNESYLTSAIQSVKSGIASHPDIIDFVNYCRQSSFSPQHPWVLRFSGDTDADLASQISTDYLEESSLASGSLGNYSSYTPSITVSGGELRSVADMDSFVSTSMSASNHDSVSSSIYDDDSISLDATGTPRSLASLRRGETESLRSDLSQTSNSNIAMTPRTREAYDELNSNFTTTPRSFEFEDRNSVASFSRMESNSIMSSSLQGGSLLSSSESISMDSESLSTSVTRQDSRSVVSKIRRQGSQASVLSGKQSEGTSFEPSISASSRKDSNSGSVFSHLSPSVVDSMSPSTYSASAMSYSSSSYTQNTPHTYQNSSSEQRNTLGYTTDSSAGTTSVGTRTTFASSYPQSIEKQASFQVVDGIASIDYEVSEHSATTANRSLQEDSGVFGDKSASVISKSESVLLSSHPNISPRSDNLRSLPDQTATLNVLPNEKGVSRSNSVSSHGKVVMDSSQDMNASSTEFIENGTPRSSSHTSNFNRSSVNYSSNGSRSEAETTIENGTLSGTESHRANSSRHGTGTDQSGGTGPYVSSSRTDTFTEAYASTHSTRSDKSVGIAGNASIAGDSRSVIEREGSYSKSISPRIHTGDIPTSSIVAAEKDNLDANTSSIENIFMETSTMKDSHIRNSVVFEQPSLSPGSVNSSGSKGGGVSVKSSRSAVGPTPSLLQNESADIAPSFSRSEADTSLLRSWNAIDSATSHSGTKESATEEYSSTYTSEGYYSSYSQRTFEEESDGADSYTQFSATGVSPRSLASERPSQSLSKVESAVIGHSSSSVINGSSVDQKSVSYQNSNVITEADENYEEDDFESLA